MRSFRSAVLAGIIFSTAGNTALAQEEVGAGVTIDMEAMRALLIAGLEENRMMDVEFARAIPDSALRWAPTPEVRDFAEQVEHAALDNALFVARGILEMPVPSFGDTAVYLNDKEALVVAVNATYDWVIESLRNLSSEELLDDTVLFGREMTKWRVYLQMLEHAYWTRGQMVPYFRIHGTAPPRYRPF